VNGDVGNCTVGLPDKVSCQPVCHTGFTVSGPSYCNSGTLIPAACLPDPCDASTPPVNGGVGNCTSSLPTGEVCIPSCNSGYAVSGATTCYAANVSAATCLANACDASVAPANGGVGNCTSAVPSESVCQPTCNYGFTVSGPSTCFAGNLSAATCNADPCDASTPPVNGGLGNCTSSIPSGSICQPTCNYGWSTGYYTVSGPTYCYASNVTAAECLANSCNASAAPANGGVGNCTDSVPSESMCQPTCNSGFTVSGISTCFAGNLSAATCLPDPCDASAAPSNGNLGNCPSSLSSGSECLIQCDSGYTPSGPSKCYAGTLDAATCVPACDAGTPPANGGLGNCSAAIQTETACLLTCNVYPPHGFTVSGPSHCISGVLYPATCLENPCNASVPPLNGGVGNCTNSVPSRSICQPTCNNDLSTGYYTVTGPSYCYAQNLTAAECLANPCDASTPPFNGAVGNCTASVASESLCAPTCDTGWVPSKYSTCFAGILDSAVCLDAPCDASTPPANGALGNCTNETQIGLFAKGLPSGHVCQPVCNPGYTVTGVSTCSFGVFTMASCLPDPCDASAAPLNGAVGDCTASLKSGWTCQPVCNSGYTVSGASRCTAGSLDPATCLPNPCDASTPPLNGAVGNCTSTVPSGELCQPTCNPGYSPSGPSICIAGSLVTTTTCLPNPCDASVAPANGGLGNCTGSVPHGSVCQPTCNHGWSTGYYTVSGVSSCHLGNLTAATCLPHPCNASVAPINGGVGDCTDNIPSGSSCQPTCNAWYTVSGPSTCLAGNLSAAICYPACDGSTPPANGGVGNCSSAMLVGETCQPTCERGFTVSGISDCQKGVFISATCLPDPCDASVPPANGAVGNCTNSLPTGDLCFPICNGGYTVSGPSTCYASNVTAAKCFQDSATIYGHLGLNNAGDVNSWVGAKHGILRAAIAAWASPVSGSVSYDASQIYTQLDQIGTYIRVYYRIQLQSREAAHAATRLIGYGVKRFLEALRSQAAQVHMNDGIAVVLAQNQKLWIQNEFETTWS